jgi:hypothetical protein
MKPRTLAFLAIATLLCVVGAIWVNSNSPAFTHANGGQLVFPDLSGKINDAAKVVVATADHKFTVVRGDKGWGLADKYGYPAKFDMVKGTLVALAQLRTVEAKTAEPSLYSRLEVQDPSVKGAKSAEITVEDAKGAKLASLILGKRHYGRGSSQAVEIYVRKPGDKQSWLATGSLERSDDMKLWMQRQIADVTRERVHTVTVTPGPAATADDKPFALTRDKPGDADFALVDMPPEDKLKSSYELNSIAGGLDVLLADDVLPAKDLKPDDKLFRTLEYKTFDGMTLDFRIYQQGKKKWARITASFDAANAAPAPAKDAKKKDASASQLKSADEVKKSVEAINARAKEWVYGLADSDLVTLDKKLSDLIEPKEKTKPKS